MSTATTWLCNYGHEECTRHPKPSVVLRAVEPPKADIVAELLELLEGLPVVFRSVRAERGLTMLQAAKEMGVHHSLVPALEQGKGNGGGLNVMYLALEWIGPLSPDEWNEYRFSDSPSHLSIGREELLLGLQTAMRVSRDPAVVAAHVGYDNRHSLARRLYRMRERKLAQFFGREKPRGADDPDIVSATRRLDEVGSP